MFARNQRRYGLAGENNTLLTWNTVTLSKRFMFLIQACVARTFFKSFVAELVLCMVSIPTSCASVVFILHRKTTIMLVGFLWLVVAAQHSFTTQSVNPKLFVAIVQDRQLWRRSIPKIVSCATLNQKHSRSQTIAKSWIRAQWKRKTNWLKTKELENLDGWEAYQTFLE